ncbi:MULTISPECIES: hypothetical protein [Burkholderia]|uniref:hypothetical protein n=1 Tax=Burkholderia TaxID=32008 RepID=UPI000B7A7476|nr:MULTISPECIES: hypothetical protein [Burkholderia]MBY4725719.1 hypothetical protein [Burkholderia contaminans]MCI3969257.1 hypothetical protein [Burkholderia sp. HI4860]OXI98491.1 hypothetical protein CFB48_24135 [Burkholderia sp. AU33647]
MSIHYSGVKLHDGLMPLTHTAASFRTDLIKAEPMFFRADPGFAESHGDLLTQDFLAAARDIWGSLEGCIVDSRHHMLMPGMYPCIPGWHTDDAPRDQSRWGGQPDIFNPEYVTEHLLCIVDVGTESLTEFLTGDVGLYQPHFERELERGRNFYRTADHLFNTVARAKPPTAITVKSFQIAEFDVHSWHRGQSAKQRGFRWFIRITRNSRHAVQNELRSNAQVYITDSSYGW